MASEPVLSSEVGKRTSRVFQPVMVMSVMAAAADLVDVTVSAFLELPFDARNGKEDD